MRAALDAKTRPDSETAWLTMVIRSVAFPVVTNAVLVNLLVPPFHQVNHTPIGMLSG